MKKIILAVVVLASATSTFAASINTQIDSCKSIAIQFKPNGGNSDGGDVDQLYNLTSKEAQARAKAVVARNKNSKLINNGSCQLVVAYKE
ncbi:hypothetical protein AWB71_05327 [Caballeronia peredens]|nr:hypothetical protein AWB71_05327 [Caballeronia peredens]